MNRILETSAICAFLFLFGPTSHASAGDVQKPKRVEIDARRYSFQPASVTLKRGEPVVLVLKSEDVAHGLKFRELGVDVRAPKGHTAQVTFTPDKAGDFIGHCSTFCGAGHGEMTLKLHVEQ